MPPDDAALLQAVADGDTAAIGSLYDLHGSQCFSLAVRLLHGNRESAEDVVCQVFVRLRQPSHGDGAESVSIGVWLLHMTRSACLELVRSRSSTSETGDHIPETRTSTECWTAVAQGVISEEMRAALHELIIEQKRAIELAYFEGLTCQAIAQHTNASLETVKERLRPGPHSLRNVFDICKDSLPDEAADQDAQFEENVEDTAEYDGRDGIRSGRRHRGENEDSKEEMDSFARQPS